MIENLPPWISLLFLLACIYTVVLFYFSNGKSKGLTLLIFVWAGIQSVLASIDFYEVGNANSVRFIFVVAPTVILIIYSLLPRQRKRILDNRDIKVSTFLHAVRFPVELVLFGLFTNKLVPELMTFEGRNYDIIMGLTAPIIGFLFLKKMISDRVLLIWNIIGLFFIFFILMNGILSAELPFQQFAFDQPNRAVFYFPFILLPALVVPIVIWTHLTDILKLVKKQ